MSRYLIEKSRLASALRRQRSQVRILSGAPFDDVFRRIAQNENHTCVRSCTKGIRKATKRRHPRVTGVRLECREAVGEPASQILEWVELAAALRRQRSQISIIMHSPQPAQDPATQRPRCEEVM